MEATRRIEELVFALDALPDPAAASAARELLQIVLELHGGALARAMEIVADDPGASRLAQALAHDPAVRGVLLLHGLHPDRLEQRVRDAVERLRPHLAVQGVAIEALDVADAAVRIRLGASDAGTLRADAPAAIRREIEQAVFDAAPDALRVDIEGMPAPLSFVAVSSITVRQRGDGAARALA